MSATRTTPESELAILVVALRAWGLDYLTAGVSRQPPPAIPPVQLLQRLARAPEPRVRDATIALLLLHPQLAEVVSAALASVYAAVLTTGWEIWYNYGMNTEEHQQQKMTFVLPRALMDRLRTLAHAQHRSLTGELIVAIEAHLDQEERKPKRV